MSSRRKGKRVNGKKKDPTIVSHRKKGGKVPI